MLVLPTLGQRRFNVQLSFGVCAAGQARQNFKGSQSTRLLIAKPVLLLPDV